MHTKQDWQITDKPSVFIPCSLELRVQTYTSLCNVSALQSSLRPLFIPFPKYFIGFPEKGWRKKYPASVNLGTQYSGIKNRQCSKYRNEINKLRNFFVVLQTHFNKITRVCIVTRDMGFIQIFRYLNYLYVCGNVHGWVCAYECLVLAEAKGIGSSWTLT